MSRSLLAVATLLSIASICLAWRQIAEGEFPDSLTTLFLMVAVVLQQPAPKQALGRRGAVLSYGCIGIALAIVAVQLLRLTDLG
jgi:hypothetical protein